LSEKHEQIHQLLLNVLPLAVIQQLQQSNKDLSLVERTARKFESVSILFADIADFTRLASRLPATEVLSILNELFCIFDTLAEKHGLEKIKTIGG
jgi:class 3 adenylate cyclase